ncbi:glycosyltransferase family 2 protein [Neptunomonas sp. XY-337]|uniref:glycosyltransferase family 2 protein n=1 Tax=Neptunomonas sp. XY-337 TaxID=2561897 RepID=UPI0010A9B837|nr:glycosyltransferase family 2 protein [Neptunomonas sp. XY-337]
MFIWLISLLVILWALIVYHHVVYPLLMVKLQARPTSVPAAQQRHTHYQPSVTILVPAYNEADVIADKIRNVAFLDYPSHKLELLIVCDGCQDDTAALARQAAQEWNNSELNVRVIEFQANRGKVALLNLLIPTIKTDIVALSDASALISMDALNIASQHFVDPNVGVVAATYTLLNPGSAGEQKYWDYQVSIKRGEAAIGSPIGVHGALYFFRQPLFQPLPADTINDDFILPMEIVSRGYEARYDTHLIALELEQASLAMDQQRRVRIAAGNFQQLLRLPKLLSPRLGGTAWSFLSGKALRAVMPLILLAQLVLCSLLTHYQALFLVITLLQLGGIVLARLSLYLPTGELPSHKVLKPLKLAFYLINGYYSSLIGTVRYLLGMDRGPWQSVPKS